LSNSPDGKKIAFYSLRDGNKEIYVMNVDSSEQIRLTNNPAEDDSPDCGKHENYHFLMKIFRLNIYNNYTVVDLLNTGTYAKIIY